MGTAGRAINEEKKVIGTAAWPRLTLLGLALACVVALAVAAGPAQGAEITNFQLERSSQQAGGHPDLELYVQSTTALEEANNAEPGTEINPCLCGDPKRIRFDFPTGFIGNPHAVPKCSLAELGLGKCNPDSQIGATQILFGQQQLYNMEPRVGEPGLLAAKIPFFGVPVFTIVRARTDSDYGLTAETPDIWHPLIGLSSLRIWIWGVPTDPVHDKNRAPLDLQAGFCNANYPDPCFPTPVKAASPPVPYLQSPTVCGEHQTASLEVEYYDHTVDRAETSWEPNTTCDLLGFAPAVAVNPTTDQTDAPSGIDINIRVPQTQSPTVPSPSQLRSVEFTLPEGYTVNPNAADGKEVCTDEEAAFGTLEPASCPEAAKIGTLDLTSVALPEAIPGGLYLGEPKPGEPYRLVLTASGFETHVKLPGTVTLDSATGLVKVLFDDLPQSPLQEFDLHIFGAERGLLATPERCGTYVMDAAFGPWADVLGKQLTTTDFSFDAGPSGSSCPGGQRPHAPSLVAGSPDNTAGKHSPFAVRIDRRDGDQNLSGLRIATPPGFLASLRGIPYCPEVAIAQLSNPAHTGLDEQSSPACPPASEIGAAITSAGAGSRPVHTPGRVYLAGPHAGAPLSLVTVVPAVSGPYDLGNVAVRSALHVDPTTAQVTTVSDPLPQILDGIPLRLRTILVNLNRPNFTLNPSNCSPFTIDTSVFGDEGAVAGLSAFYQVANCVVMPFAPKLALRLLGSTKRLGHPAVRAVLTMKDGESNIRRAVVAMPKTLQLDNAHIGTICTRVQFASDSCPADSIYGRASAVTPLLDRPLEGPVYLRASDNKLPDLVAHLKGQIEIELVGRIDTTKRGGLRTTFAAVPDAPVRSFTLQLESGKKGLLVNTRNLCKAPPRASVQMVGQNGIRQAGRKRVRTGCSRGDRRSKAARRSRHRRLTRARAVR